MPSAAAATQTAGTAHAAAAVGGSSAGPAPGAAGNGAAVVVATAGQSAQASAAGTGAITAGAGPAAGMSAPELANDIPAPDSFPKLEASQFGMPKVISTQFDLAEGPVWDHCNQRLLFVDVNNRKIHTFVPGGEIGVFMDQTNYANGLVFDPDGNLLMAEMGGGTGGRIVRLHMADKKVDVLIDHNPMGGKLQTSDDLTVRSDGTIYFTDPIITHGPYLNDVGSLSSHPYYMLKPGEDGMREVVQEGMTLLPNGIRLTPDEKTLLIAAYQGGRILKFDVAADGSLKAGGDFATGLSNPDSMCMDAAGNLYVGTRGGLQVFRSDGTMVKVIPITANARTTNCGFGGPDGKTLFITAWTAFLQLDNMPIPGLEWYRNKKIKC
jgi:gluconolactonase